MAENEPQSGLDEALSIFAKELANKDLKLILAQQNLTVSLMAKDIEYIKKAVDKIPEIYVTKDQLATVKESIKPVRNVAYGGVTMLASMFIAMTAIVVEFFRKP